MKRLHVNVAVTDLGASVRFYTTLFDAEPGVLKEDYAKWMLEDPRVNFAISTRGARKGMDHLGIQVETDDELADVYRRLTGAGAPLIEQGETVCCYARSEKNWVFDPEGIAWETFLTHGDSPVFGGDDAPAAEAAAPCCAGPEEASGCCG